MTAPDPLTAQAALVPDTLAVLDPSPDGAKLYESLGFDVHRQLTDRWFYLPMPDTAAQ